MPNQAIAAEGHWPAYGGAQCPFLFLAWKPAGSPRCSPVYVVICGVIESDARHNCSLLLCADSRHAAGEIKNGSTEILSHLSEQEANPAAVDGVLELGILRLQLLHLLLQGCQIHLCRYRSLDFVAERSVTSENWGRSLAIVESNKCAAQLQHTYGFAAPFFKRNITLWDERMLQGAACFPIQAVQCAHRDACSARPCEYNRPCLVRATPYIAETNHSS